ncbi:MAG: hypothetical protein ACRD8W_32825, partial [Nitrososphaeraceae archaeon]
MNVRTKFLLSGAIIILVILSSQINFNLDLLSSITSSLTGNAGIGDESNVLRLGYFPNLNHAQVI